MPRPAILTPFTAVPPQEPMTRRIAAIYTSMAGVNSAQGRKCKSADRIQRSTGKADGLHR